MSLVIVGSVALDSVKTPHGEVSDVLGGSTMYASMASKHFCETKIVGVVGNDFPEVHLDLLADHKICSIGLEVVPGKTFCWKGVYNDLNKAETLDTQLNVFADFDPKLPSHYSTSRFLFLANIDPELQLKVLDQMDKPELIGCDTMNFWISSKKQELFEVIRKVDILFVNDDEIKQLTGLENIFEAAEMLLEMGPRYLVVKRGEFGSVLIGENELFFTPIFPVKKVMDPTGAGDSFAGGFMGFLAGAEKLDSNTLRQAMLYGTVLASFNVESFSLERLRDIDLAQISQRWSSVKNSMLV